jgi:hypothetical protein
MISHLSSRSTLAKRCWPKPIIARKPARIFVNCRSIGHFEKRLPLSCQHFTVGHEVAFSSACFSFSEAQGMKFHPVCAASGRRSLQAEVNRFISG